MFIQHNNNYRFSFETYMTIQPQVLGSDDVTKYGFNFMDHDLYPSIKWLVTPMIFIPLMHQWTCLPSTFIIIAHRVYSRLRLLFASSSIHRSTFQDHKLQLVGLKLPSENQVDLYIFYDSTMCCFQLQSHFHILKGNQEQCTSLHTKCN